MRIIFLTSAFPPEAEGAATHLPELAESLQSAGHRTRILAVVNRHEIKDTYSFRVKRISRSQFTPVRSLRVLWNLVKDGRNCDVIYTYGIWWQAAVASFITGKPWIIKFVADRLWEEAVEKGSEEDLQSWAKSKKSFWQNTRYEFNMIWARAAQQCMVSCSSLKQILLDWGVPREKIEMIANALPKNPQEEDQATYLAQWADKEDLRLICAGNITKAKNLQVVIEALTLKDKVRLVVAGDGPYLENIKALVREKNLNERVLFTGKISRHDLAGYIRECQILVLSSRLGHFNYALLEAQQQGRAVFASQCGLHADFIEEGENAWLFGPHNADELVNLMQRFEKGDLNLKEHEDNRAKAWESYVDQTNDMLTAVINP